MTGAEPPTSRRPRWPIAVVAGLAVVALAVGMFWFGRASVVGTVPDSTSADAGFLRDMQTHHAQAVEMAMLVRDRSADPAIRTIAYDIALAQSQQAGVMYGWLEQWGLDQYGTPMAWMHDADAHAGHAAPDVAAPMPGMATPDQLAGLEGASGADADRAFLTLMIAHHEGGIEMAEAAERLAAQPLVRDLAASMIEVQTAEIAAMQDLLDAR